MLSRRDNKSKYRQVMRQQYSRDKDDCANTGCRRYRRCRGIWISCSTKYACADPGHVGNAIKCMACMLARGFPLVPMSQIVPPSALWLSLPGCIHIRHCLLHVSLMT